MKRTLKIIGAILFWVFFITLFTGLIPDSMFSWVERLPSFLQTLLLAVIGFFGWFLSVLCWSVLAEEIDPIYADWKKREEDKKRAKEEAKWQEVERKIMYAEWEKRKRDNT